jgi:hypothetical protein
MKKPKADDAKLTLPFPPPHLSEQMVTTCLQQVAAVQKCPDYANHPDIQALAIATAADATSLGTTLSDLGNAKVVVVTLEGTRDQKIVSLRSNHAALAGALNNASKGKKESIVAWGGTVATRVPTPTSTDAPTAAFAKTTKAPGAVRTGCAPERGAICYLFQHGTDPTNPDAWPKPDMSGGSKHTVTGLPIGQKVYFRIAIVRRRGGQSNWSGLMEVTVR